MIRKENLTRLTLFYVYSLGTVLSFAGFGHRFASMVEWVGYSLLAALFMSLPRLIGGDSASEPEGLSGEDRYVTHLVEEPDGFEFIFDDTGDAQYLEDDDGLRREALRCRITTYVDRRLKEDPRAFQRELTAAGNFNTLVEKEIAAGRL